MTSSVWRIAIEAVQGGNPNDPMQTQEADIAIDDVRLLWPSCESKIKAQNIGNFARFLKKIFIHLFLF